MQEDYGLWLIDVGPTFHIYAGFTSFFLIFRTNQSNHRYWVSNDCLKEVQVSVRELHRQFICYIKGGVMLRGEKDSREEEWEHLGKTAKTDATRYLVAYLIVFKMHARMAFEGYMLGEIDENVMLQLNFDRARLRGLLSREEFAVIDMMMRIDPTPFCRLVKGRTRWFWSVSTESACRGGHIIIFFLRCLACSCCHAREEWGWMERCLNLSDVMIGHLMRAFEAMDQNITTPLPLPYCHLMKVMMFVFIILYPVVGIGNEDGRFMKSLVTLAISSAMLGLESISMEIEHPFGDEANDFDTMRIIAAVEGSMWDIMICRNDPAQASFDWIQPPEEYNKCGQFLCLREQVQDVLDMMPGGRKHDMTLASPLAVLPTQEEKKEGNDFWKDTEGRSTKQKKPSLVSRFARGMTGAIAKGGKPGDPRFPGTTPPPTVAATA